MTEYYLFIVLMTVGVSLIMMITVMGNAMLPRRVKYLYLWLFGTLALAALCEMAGVSLNGRGETARMLIPVHKAIEFSLAPATAVFYAAVLEPDAREVRAAMVIVIIHAVVECVLAPFGIIIAVDEAGIYRHGPAYLIYPLVYLASALFMLVMVRRFSDSYQYGNRRAPYLTIAFIFACLIVQMVFSDVRIVWIAIAIGAIMVYSFYCSVVQQTDALTRLLNRYSFEGLLTALKDKVVLLLIDVDDFKTVNDTYGHDAGDECLRSVGQAIYGTFDAHGQCYRIGGDEFCVVLVDGANAGELMESFNKRLADMRREQPVLPSVSIGEALFDPAYDDFASVYRRADELMYASKRERKMVETAE